MPRRAARAAIVAACLGLPGPAIAQDYAQVETQESFLQLVEGRTLTIWLLGVNLQVHAGGTIGGEARGDAVTGDWTWQDGLFCRDMAWGDMAIPYDCQLVEANGTNRVRFTSEGGAGDSAAFSLE